MKKWNISPSVPYFYPNLWILACLIDPDRWSECSRWMASTQIEPATFLLKSQWGQSLEGAYATPPLVAPQIPPLQYPRHSTSILCPLLPLHSSPSQTGKWRKRLLQGPRIRTTYCLARELITVSSSSSIMRFSRTNHAGLDRGLWSVD